MRQGRQDNRNGARKQMSNAYGKIESDVLRRFELGYEFEIGYILH